MEPLKCDHTKRLETSTVISLSGFHFIFLWSCDHFQTNSFDHINRNDNNNLWFLYVTFSSGNGTFEMWSHIATDNINRNYI